MDLLTALTTLAPSIVAIATLIFAYLQNRDSNKRQLQQLREQQEHEEKKAKIESDATKERQSKERLQEIYANTVRTLSEISMMVNQGPTIPYDKHVMNNTMGEAQKWLALLVIYYYGDDEDNKFHNFYTHYLSFSRQDNLDDVEYLRRCVIDFAISDPRLK